MQTLQDGYASVALIFRINLDRLLYIATIGAALFGGAWIGLILT